MSSKYGAELTPAALSEYVHYVSQEHKRTIVFELEHLCRPAAACGFTLRCKAYPVSGDQRVEPLEHAAMEWPTYSHRTVLGALYWLLLTVEKEMDAGDALAALGEAQRV